MAHGHNPCSPEVAHGFSNPNKASHRVDPAWFLSGVDVAL